MGIYRAVEMHIRMPYLGLRNSRRRWKLHIRLGQVLSSLITFRTKSESALASFIMNQKAHRICVSVNRHSTIRAWHDGFSHAHISYSPIYLSSPWFSLYIYLPVSTWFSRLLSICPLLFNIEHTLLIPTQIFASNT